MLRPRRREVIDRRLRRCASDPCCASLPLA